MDVVYIVRDGDKNDALKYSLRSLKNVEHDDVYLVGYKPAWVKNVKHIERFQRGKSKFFNITRNIYEASITPDISDDFIYMDDDYYIMREIEDIPPAHSGDLNTIIERISAFQGKVYVDGFQDMYDRLVSKGIERPFCYDLHVPIVYNKEKLKEVIEMDDSYALTASIFFVRTFYGSYWNIGGQHQRDSKIHDGPENRRSVFEGQRYLSSAGKGPSGELLKYLKEHFPEKSQYE